MFDIADSFAQLIKENGLKFNGRTVINEELGKQIVTVCYRDKHQIILFLEVEGAQVLVRGNSSNLRRTLDLHDPESMFKIGALFRYIAESPRNDGKQLSLSAQIVGVRNTLRQYQYHVSPSLLGRMDDLIQQLLTEAQRFEANRNDDFPAKAVAWFGGKHG